MRAVRHCVWHPSGALFASRFARLAEFFDEGTAQQAGWQRERQDLITKNDMARAKVEAMLDRLRSMESES